MNALIIGGTRGIGQATAQALRERGWEVEATGRHNFDVHQASLDTRWDPFHFDALIFCAGDLHSRGASAFDFPLAFYMLATREIVKEGGVLVAVSSVAAGQPAKVNPHYAAAKAALESYALTVAHGPQAEVFHWRVEVVRFDLVLTEMLLDLPQHTLAGRKIIEPEAAALRILAVMGIEP